MRKQFKILFLVTIIGLTINYSVPYLNSNSEQITYFGCGEVRAERVHECLRQIRNLGYQTPSKVYCGINKYLTDNNYRMSEEDRINILGLYLLGSDGIYVEGSSHILEYLVRHETFHYNQYLRYNFLWWYSKLYIMNSKESGEIVFVSKYPYANDVAEFTAHYFATCKAGSGKDKLCTGYFDKLYFKYLGF